MKKREGSKDRDNSISRRGNNANKKIHEKRQIMFLK